MRALLRAMHFFTVVTPLPQLMLYSFAVATVLSSLALVIDGTRASVAAIPILTLQVFATATGFVAHARRGHYDVLLTGGIGRLRTASMQWLMAAVPGLMSWGVLAAVEWATTGTRYTLASGTWAALFITSTLPWALTVALPRFSGAIGWLLVSVMIVTLVAPASATPLIWSVRSPPGWVAAAGSLLFPLRLAGVEVAGDGLAVVPAVIVAATSMAVALAWVRRTPLPLEAGQ